MMHMRRRGAHAASTFGVVAALLASAALSGPYYKIEVLAQTGQETTAGATLTQIDAFPTINDSGTMAFLGTVAAGTTVFTADGTGDPIALAFSPVLSRNYASGIQINNAGQVVAEDQISGNYFVRLWGPLPGSNTIVAFGGSDPVNDQFAGLSAIRPPTEIQPLGLLPPPIWHTPESADTAVICPQRRSVRTPAWRHRKHQ